MAVFLFGVDWLWSILLQILGVLKFAGGGAFGSRLAEPRRDRRTCPGGRRGLGAALLPLLSRLCSASPSIPEASGARPDLG